MCIKTIRKTIAFKVTLMFLLVLPFSCQSIPMRSQAQLIAHKKVDSGYPYYMYVPESQSIREGASIPLMVFLHGGGVRRDNLEPNAMKHGPLSPVFHSGIERGIIDSSTLNGLNEKVRDSLVLVPQAPTTEYWDAVKLHRLIQTVIEEYPVDAKRIYLTGLSMGGFAVWGYSAQYPETAAALIPVCGGYFSTEPIPVELQKKPIWAFHSFTDPVVSRSETQDVIMNILMETKIQVPFRPRNRFLTDTGYPHKEGDDSKYAFGEYTLSWKDGTLLGWNKIKELPPGTINYTIYPMNDHNSWTKTYDKPYLYEWIYSQELAPDSP